MLKQQNELIQLIGRHTSKNGTIPTLIPSLYFSRYSGVTEPRYGIQNPSLCIVVQGDKQVLLAQERFFYGPANYFVASVDLPITGQVTTATSQNPYLSLKLEFTPSQILEILQESDLDFKAKKNLNRGMFVSSLSLPLLDSVTRLVRLVESPNDIPVLAPLMTKEILYRVLLEPHGEVLKQIAIRGSNTSRINDAIEYIMNNFDRRLLMEELAKLANMSVSSLHRNFKEVTAMSPIQFQKQLRLQEARRLLLTETTDATDVAFQVGYESPSQFSREYSRIFGLPPIQDIKQLKENYDDTKNA
ncbi:AraC family transcriptional regulator [Terribacillus saccharophilus]|uniref:AraC family transcriptional regulator n=1 Tax=Terribacillus saccharophilus TaxID=361277 RepID=A0ABX4H2Z1_9BACI|nr:AraC family transcriptional regulator [Terribacillus saccharophilus]PAD37112.1 AraC family transcriptional regulator [Terribacillus saccharophilus]PAD97421.1 AraC family transcriptional regulator [Terribacillus saccharophilus]PAE01469.1 AraC family transcriptional regulator [Terribacillus saccharophilus]